MERKILTVNRDCPARLVPIGTEVVIPKNSFVTLVQAMGSAYTVVVNGNMVRVDGMDADALGFTAQHLEYASADPDGGVNMEEVQMTLKSIYDPEIPVDIVSLGLVYACQIESQDSKKTVNLRVTLTSPGCGMGPVIIEDIKRRIKLVPNVSAVNVEMVFDPPWDRSMMSAEAQLELGLF